MKDIKVIYQPNKSAVIRIGHPRLDEESHYIELTESELLDLYGKLKKRLGLDRKEEAA